MGILESSEINHRTGQINKPGQPYSEESWKALQSKIMDKLVRLDIIDIDRYKRMVGMIWIDNRNITLEMVRAGYAEAYTEYLKEPFKNEFMRAEKEAKAVKRGVWGLVHYERPGLFRKKLKEE